MKHARLDNSYEAELRKVLAVDLVVLDDFAIDVLDLTESRDLYEILTERHRTGSIIVTSNRGPDEWLATFADPVRAQSAIDRFTQQRLRSRHRGRVLSPALETDPVTGGASMIAASTPVPDGCGNAAAVEITDRFPPPLGNLAQNARFPHFHKPMPGPLIMTHGKNTSAGAQRLEERRADQAG